jgi:hypothetical protein
MKRKTFKLNKLYWKYLAVQFVERKKGETNTNVLCVDVLTKKRVIRRADTLIRDEKNWIKNCERVKRIENYKKSNNLKYKSRFINQT